MERRFLTHEISLTIQNRIFKDITKSMFTNHGLKKQRAWKDISSHPVCECCSSVLTAPISKAKKFAVPIATALALSYGATKQAFRRKRTREEIEKRTKSFIQNCFFQEECRKLKKSNENLRKIAMTSIRYSDEMISKQKAHIEKLATENCILKIRCYGGDPIQSCQRPV